ncbi:MAG: FAD-dependent oxidoreductase [Phycisphaerales bacterium]|nr:FAD-dependent oxidoreductase [Phycisphaerales bacterium]
MPIIDKRNPLNMNTDILVVGGGAAGLAAAVTAARQNLKVTLIERYGFCGGGAVAGLSGTICGMYEASDNPSAPPKQVVHGFIDEFIHVLESNNGLGPPVHYGKTYARVHDPFAWRKTADQLLTNANVQILYHTTATAVLFDGDKLEGITAYNKQGPTTIRAKLTIDASGDADIVAMAGFPTFIGDESSRTGNVQNPTMIFRLQNVDIFQFQNAYGTDTIMPPQITALIAEKNSDPQSPFHHKLPRGKIWLFPTPRPGELLCNCTRILGSDARELNTLFAQDFTEAEILGRLQAQTYAQFFIENLQGCRHAFLADTAPQVGIRQTRQALGVSTLQNTDILTAKKHKDAIARSPWPIELHAGHKPKVEWLLNDTYEIPYTCFVPAKGENLLIAGRCLSAQHEAIASARVTAQCFSYGHAIAHAAALAVKNKIPPRQIDGADLRKILNNNGAQLD